MAQLTATRDACLRSSVPATRSARVVPRVLSRRSTVSVNAVAAPEKPASQYQRPDATGRYGKFGGKYVPETLIPALAQLEIDYQEAMADPSFKVSKLGLMGVVTNDAAALSVFFLLPK